MENKDNVIGIDKHKAYQHTTDTDKTKLERVTNPITKNLAKFFQTQKDKLNIKDILR